MVVLTENLIDNFKKHLIDENKSNNTIEKYVFNVNSLKEWLSGEVITMERLEAYRQHLIETYSTASVKLVIISLNKFFSYNNLDDFKLQKVKDVKVFKEVLSKNDYEKLLTAAKQRSRQLYFIIRTICATGLMASELNLITVENLKKGRIERKFKGVSHTILIPRDFCQCLLDFAQDEKIFSGCIFITNNGTPLSRSCLHKKLKNLCDYTDVPAERVSPNSIRLMPLNYLSEQEIRSVLY